MSDSNRHLNCAFRSSHYFAGPYNVLVTTPASATLLLANENPRPPSTPAFYSSNPTLAKAPEKLHMSTVIGTNAFPRCPGKRKTGSPSIYLTCTTSLVLFRDVSSALPLKTSTIRSSDRVGISTVPETILHGLHAFLHIHLRSTSNTNAYLSKVQHSFILDRITPHTQHNILHLVMHTFGP